MRIRKKCKHRGCAKNVQGGGKSGLCKAHGGGKRCESVGCTKSARGKSGLCIKHGGENRRKICEREGCTKSARGKTAFCGAHGGGKRCESVGCTKSAADATTFCKAHGGGKRCETDGCTKTAQGKTTRCVEHGGGKRCESEGCSKSARGKSGLCIKHGGENSRKRCETDGCTKSAQGKSVFCVEHGGGKRCESEGCTKSAIGKTSRCVEHGGGKRCESEGCSKSARGKSVFCVQHGGGFRCPVCIDCIDSRCANRGYDGMCASCFKHKFPGDPRAKRIPIHAKELRVRAEIEKHFDGFVHDKPLCTKECDCTIRRRIDHRKVIGGTLLGIETDEHAHVHYSQEDERNRYDDIAMGHGGSMIFVRFDPDLRGVSFERKLKVLIEEIKNQIAIIESGERDPSAGFLTEIKLFYEPTRHRIVSVVA